jgi:hypothetical protein
VFTQSRARLVASVATRVSVTFDQLQTPNRERVAFRLVGAELVCPKGGTLDHRSGGAVDREKVEVGHRPLGLDHPHRVAHPASDRLEAGLFSEADEDDGLPLRMRQGEDLAGLPLELGQFEQGGIGARMRIRGARRRLVPGQHPDDQGGIGQVDLSGCAHYLHTLSFT